MKCNKWLSKHCEFYFIFMSNQISFLHLCENNALSHESIGKTQYTHRHTHVHAHTQTQTTFCEWVKEAIEGFSQVKEHFLINDDEPWMKKPLLAPFLSQFAITSVHFTLVLSSFPGWKGVDIQVPRNRTPSPTLGRHNQALTAFLTLNRNRFLYMWGVFCLLVFVCLGLGAFVYRLGFVPHYMEDHSCQKKKKNIRNIRSIFLKHPIDKKMLRDQVIIFT